jgi:hypothetical protein
VARRGNSEDEAGAEILTLDREHTSPFFEHQPIEPRLPSCSVRSPQIGLE